MRKLALRIWNWTIDLLIVPFLDELSSHLIDAIANSFIMSILAPIGSAVLLARSLQ